MSTDNLPADQEVDAMARDYMSWTKPELCRALAYRVNELKQLRQRLEQAELAARMNAETIREMQEQS